MKKSIKRKFIDMLSPNNIDFIFFQHGFKLLILLMASMFIIEKAITIIVAILDLVNACCEDPIHQMTCAGLFLMCIRVVFAKAGPMCRKHINKGDMLLYKQSKIDALKNELHRIVNGKKEESEEF